MRRAAGCDRKGRWSTEEAARAALERMRENPRAFVTPCAVYPCERHGWHVTAKPNGTWEADRDPTTWGKVGGRNPGRRGRRS